MGRLIVAKSWSARLYGWLYVIAGVLFVSNVWQLQQMNERHNELMSGQSMAVTETSSRSVSAKICVPLLPVHLWNRNPEDVPVPPPWRRRLV